jgi:hypothetical protein
MFVPKNNNDDVLKKTNIFQKQSKWFLILMKFLVYIKHCDSK